MTGLSTRRAGDRPWGPTALARERWQLYRERGWWEDQTLWSLFAASADRVGGKPAVIDGEHTLDYRELRERTEAIATALHDTMSVRAGDTVAYQLPNWWETVALLLACSRLGAVVNPLHLVYRAPDVRYVVSRTRPRVLIVPAGFGRTDYVDVARAALADLEPQPLLAVVRSSAPAAGMVSFETTYQSAGAGASPMPPSLEAAAVSLILFTSGTTARPKGALHSDNTLVRLVRDMVERYDLVQDDVVFVPSTMTHVSGLSFVWSALFTGGTAVLLDNWEPGRALDVVLRTRSTFVGGATPFIRGLIDATRSRGLAPQDVPICRGNCGSADVPITLISEADEVLGAPFSRGYGLTEGIIVSASRPEDSIEHRGGTDGQVLPVNEVRVVDEELRDVDDGIAGEILVRGPSNFLGYLDPDDNREAFVDGFWVRTGDLAVRQDGYVTITGRRKDIVNRGGENISVKEIEDLIVQMPAVREVAVVGMPDPVMGERACAFVVVNPGSSPPSLAEVADYLRISGLARQKFPERLELTDELPLTSTGKVQKNALREAIRRRLAAEAGA